MAAEVVFCDVCRDPYPRVRRVGLPVCGDCRGRRAAIRKRLRAELHARRKEAGAVAPPNAPRPAGLEERVEAMAGRAGGAGRGDGRAGGGRAAPVRVTPPRPGGPVMPATPARKTAAPLSVNLTRIFSTLQE